jgi:hypothetical protein
MPVDSSTVFRLRQVLWPSALAQSVWAFAKVMAIDDSSRLARIFGIQPHINRPSIEQIIAQTQARQQENQRIKGLPTPAGPKPTQPGPSDAQKAKAMTSLSEKANATGKATGEAEDSTLQTGTAIQAHFVKAMFAFKQQFSKTWQPAPAFPPRGSILVSGLVELDMPKAWFVFDIKAHWDPKNKSFDRRSMVLHLRRVQLKRQGPAGGR